jgi:hypothetical protein
MSHIIDLYLEDLLILARLAHGDITMCSQKSTWHECVSVDCNRIMLWYNTTDDSTHIQSLVLDSDIPKEVVEWNPNPKTTYKGRDYCREWAELTMGIC